MTSSTNTDLLAQLQQHTAGLHFVTEADAPLEAVSYPAPNGELPGPELMRTLGEPDDAPVQVSSLADFLRHHTDPAGVLDSPELAALPGTPGVPAGAPGPRAGLPGRQ